MYKLPGIIKSVHGFKLIDKLNLEEKSRAFKKTDLFTLLVELHRALFKEKKHLNNAKLETELKRFYKKVEDKDTDVTIQEYSKAVIQGTNNRSARIIRGKIIADIIVTCIK